MPEWWNWQTCRTQNPVVAIPCGFDPRFRHQNKKGTPIGVPFLFCRQQLGEPTEKSNVDVRHLIFVAKRLRLIQCIWCRGCDALNFGSDPRHIGTPYGVPFLFCRQQLGELTEKSKIGGSKPPPYKFKSYRLSYHPYYTFRQACLR